MDLTRPWDEHRASGYEGGCTVTSILLDQALFVATEPSRSVTSSAVSLPNYTSRMTTTPSLATSGAQPKGCFEQRTSSPAPVHLKTAASSVQTVSPAIQSASAVQLMVPSSVTAQTGHGTVFSGPSNLTTLARRNGLFAS